MIKENRGADGSFERKDYGSPLSWALAFAIATGVVVRVISMFTKKSE